MTDVLPEVPALTAEYQVRFTGLDRQGDVDISVTARHYLDALHYFGFSLTIYTPRTSGSGEYVVRGSRGLGSEMEIVRGRGPRLFGAILRAAVQMGGMRLEEYRKATKRGEVPA